MFVFPQITTLSDFMAFIIVVMLFAFWFLYETKKLLRFFIGFAIFALTIALIYFGLNAIISTLIGGFLFIWYFATLKIIDNTPKS
ncbi:MAG: hypothetical protein IJT33_06640 [Campylobacter sp.]|nr:hypothetical protein [Campylobacter sp.]MBQ7270719.1 hypothetical protein [Campylobacter sp.]MBQ7676116.1 hypothetical protein [Campylobacter sp.]MBQ9876727.1 hypothetical protein [Campylobacter sp.]MBR0071306.1 hypothetical protein [Campylobacter sp.]